MIFTNFDLNVEEKCELKNGATRTTLVAINKTNDKIVGFKPFNGKLGTLKKGNHFFVFINKGFDSRNLFVFMDGGYGYTFHHKKPIAVDYSTGGYGNSESTLAILEEGTLIELHSYKNRRESRWLRCTDRGFVSVSNEEATLELYSDNVEMI